MKKPCLNIVFEDDTKDSIIPEIDDFELLIFSKTFIQIQARENKSLQKSNKNLKVANF